MATGSRAAACVTVLRSRSRSTVEKVRMRLAPKQSRYAYISSFSSLLRAFGNPTAVSSDVAIDRTRDQNATPKVFDAAPQCGAALLGQPVGNGRLRRRMAEQVALHEVDPPRRPGSAAARP